MNKSCEIYKRKTSRRAFLSQSVLTAATAGTAGALSTRMAFPQAPAAPSQSVVNLTSPGVVQISMVVRDVD